MSTLERAIALGAEVHAGVKDKGGSPYILHPLRVMLRAKATTRGLRPFFVMWSRTPVVSLAQSHSKRTSGAVAMRGT